MIIIFIDIIIIIIIVVVVIIIIIIDVFYISISENCNVRLVTGLSSDYREVGTCKGTDYKI